MSRLLLRLAEADGSAIAVVPDQRAEAQQLLGCGFARAIDDAHYALTEDAASRIVDAYPAPPMNGRYPDEDDDEGFLAAIVAVVEEMTRERLAR